MTTKFYYNIFLLTFLTNTFKKKKKTITVIREGHYLFICECQGFLIFFTSQLKKKKKKLVFLSFLKGCLEIAHRVDHPKGIPNFLSAITSRMPEKISLLQSLHSLIV